MQDNIRLIEWLKSRGITEATIEAFNIDIYEHPMIGKCLRIPIQGGGFSKYRRDPSQNITPKYLYDKGSRAFLYGLPHIKDAKRVLVTEGELDALVAWSHNVPAVSSTGGANTFMAEWVEDLKDKEVIICYDNDDAGAGGVVKVLSLIPTAKVVLIPDRPNIKDLTDYVKYGGDIHELLQTARHYTSVEQVQEERAARISLFESVRFHDAFIEHHTPKVIPNSRYVAKDNTRLERAKTYPITSLLEFKHKKCPCIWHNEKTPSLSYFPKTNSVYCFGCSKYGDAVDVYRQVNGCGFKEAVDELNKMV